MWSRQRGWEDGTMWTMRRFSYHASSAHIIDSVSLSILFILQRDGRWCTTSMTSSLSSSPPHVAGTETTALAPVYHHLLSWPYAMLSSASQTMLMFTRIFFHSLHDGVPRGSLTWVNTFECPSKAAASPEKDSFPLSDLAVASPTGCMSALAYTRCCLTDVCEQFNIVVLSDAISLEARKKVPFQLDVMLSAATLSCQRDEDESHLIRNPEMHRKEVDSS